MAEWKFGNHWFNKLTELTDDEIEFLYDSSVQVCGGSHSWSDCPTCSNGITNSCIPCTECLKNEREIRTIARISIENNR